MYNDVSEERPASIFKVKEAARSFETWVQFYQNIWRQNPEDNNFHTNSCETAFLHVSVVSFCVRTDNHGKCTKFIRYRCLTYAETKLRSRHNLETTYNSKIK